MRKRRGDSLQALISRRNRPPGRETNPNEF